MTTPTNDTGAARDERELPTSMHAMVQERFGGPEVLEHRHVPLPEIEPHQLLVEVRAASLNPYDWHMIRGLPYLARISAGFRRPKHPVPGADMSGVVVAVGSAVTEFTPGDEVYGSGIGGYAEYGVLSERAAARKPESASFVEAAAVPIAAITALQALKDAGNLEPGQHVAINGASGGVGTFAIQIAKAMGATVTAVCSTRNIELVESLGADHTVDYTRGDFTRTPGQYDLILDAVGTHSMSSYRRALTPNGTYVSVGAVSMGDVVGPLSYLARIKVADITGSHTMRSVLAKHAKEDIEWLRSHLEDRSVVPVIDRTYPIAELPEAMSYVETMHARGKVVLTP